ncbi:MAG TPA: DUF1292 domain-containing protein [Clostridiaceae bacterium]|jgi:hypothetical protein|nr:DUF1292 domain-containing protein [Clostridiaceae bacterium]
MRRSSKTERHRKSRATGRESYDRAEDQVLAILVDERNGREYYVSIIDVFTLDGTTYSVMYNYEPDDGSRTDPEIVIMRSWRDESGEQAFSSITSRKELNRVFDFFFERYTDSIIRS